MGRVVIPGFRKIETSGGGGEGGTTNYNDLTNKPSINNVPLVGNLNTVNLKLTDATLTEEGVPAEAKTVGTKLEEQSTSLTALSNQLGNHTVKSDVPENAVFTDTVYDDTEVKEEIAKINSNLNWIEKSLVNVNKTIVVTHDGNSDFIEDVFTNDTNSPLPIRVYGNSKTTSSSYVGLYIVIDGTTVVTCINDSFDKSLELGVGQTLKIICERNVDATVNICTPFELGKKVDSLNESLSVIGKCKNLLNPTLQTTTSNGVTCNNNGDGTYTLNGTATGSFATFIIGTFNLIKGIKYAFCGCPKDGSNIKYRCSIWDIAECYGNTEIFEVDEDITKNISIRIEEGITVSNLIFKPMITTNLNATYDDFVPYTGDGDTITSDVASLKNDLSEVEGIVSYDSYNTVEFSYDSSSKRIIAAGTTRSGGTSKDVITSIENSLASLADAINQMLSS